MTYLLTFGLFAICQLPAVRRYLNRYPVTFIVTIIIASVLAWLLTTAEMRDMLYNIDRNVWIRLEMQYAAFLTMMISDWAWIFGQGFGVPYRLDLNTYLTSHSLLNNERLLWRTPNHNSYFDIAYRLGLPLLMWLVALKVHAITLFQQTKDNGNNLPIFCLLITLALVSNPWLQDNRFVLYPGFLFGLLFSIGIKFGTAKSVSRDRL